MSDHHTPDPHQDWKLDDRPAARMRAVMEPSAIQEAGAATKSARLKDVLPVEAPEK